MFYVLKMILQTPNKAITALEIQEALMKQDMKIDIKTVYSCIKQINDFFYGWIGRDLIVSYHKLGYRIDEDIFEDGELQFLLDQIAFIRI